MQYIYRSQTLARAALSLNKSAVPRSTYFSQRFHPQTTPVRFFYRNQGIMAPVDFTGKWTIDRCENLEDYLKELGFGWFIRKMVNFVGGKLTQTITQDGDHFVVIVSGPKGDEKEEFTVGEEYEDKMHPLPDMAKILPTWDGDKLNVQVTNLDPNKKSQRLVRELTSETEMVITVYIGDVVCKRIFKKHT